jgi:hypothetical protein
MSDYYKEIDVTIVSGSQETSAVCIRGQKGISLEIPAFTTGLNTAAAAVTMSGSESATGTFRAIHLYSAASGYNAFGIPSGAGNIIVALGPRAQYLPAFIKLAVSGTNATATAAGFTLTVHMYI